MLMPANHNKLTPTGTDITVKENECLKTSPNVTPTGTETTGRGS